MYILKAFLLFALAIALAFFADLEYAAQGVSVMFLLLAGSSISAGVLSVASIYRGY